MKGDADYNKCNAVDLIFHYRNSSLSPEEILIDMKNTQYITEEMYKLIYSFNSNIEKSETDDDFQQAFTTFKKEITENTILSDKEQYSLLLYCEIQNNFLDILIKYSDDTKGACSRCIRSNWKQIFGAGGFGVLCGTLACLASGNPAVIAACAIGVGGLYTFAQISWYCGSVCSWI